MSVLSGIPIQMSPKMNGLTLHNTSTKISNSSLKFQISVWIVPMYPVYDFLGLSMTAGFDRKSSYCGFQVDDKWKVLHIFHTVPCYAHAHIMRWNNSCRHNLRDCGRWLEYCGCTVMSTIGGNTHDTLDDQRHFKCTNSNTEIHSSNLMFFSP